MFLPIQDLRYVLRRIVATKAKQGHDTSGLLSEIDSLPDSYDAIASFERRLRHLPMRAGWPHQEPDDFEAIREQCGEAWPSKPIAAVDAKAIAPRVRQAFLSSVCGCVLGKPLEVDPTLAEIRAAAEKVGCWPIRDYVPEALLDTLGRRHDSWKHTTRGRIHWVEPDDDINYTIIGMLVLEEQGRGFRTGDVAWKWHTNVPPGFSWGPERTMNARLATYASAGYGPWWATWGKPWPVEEWSRQWNPEDEACGALIRADAYGYACPGHPGLAAELAWRDGSLTHRRTGLYGEMFAAAAIAAAFVCEDPLEIFRIAARCVPPRSRFRQVVDDSVQQVSEARDWLDGYARIHGKYAEYRHCAVYQEIGLVINTLRFAAEEDPEDPIGAGIGMQVSQGCDTDSFGCTAGSILGAFHREGRLPSRWLAPFNDTLRTTLAEFHEHSLTAVAERMGRLPERVLG